MDTILDFLFQIHVLEAWYYISNFIVIISIIVFIHEFGHYIVAKWCGVRIEAFSIGFGPELCGFYDKSGTRWKFCAVPMGGYVQMFGDADAASSPDNKGLKTLSPEEQKLTLHGKNLWQKSAIVSAGPIANFILAIVILTGFIMVYGITTTSPEISQVVENSAAAQAGLEKGDVIIAIDGSEIKSFNDIQNIISINTGTEVNIRINRNGEEQSIPVTPRIIESKDVFGNDVKRALLGVQSAPSNSSLVERETLTFFPAVFEATKQTYTIAASNLRAIGQIVVGQRSFKDMGGPVKIAKYSGQAAAMGLQMVLWLMAVISISLGLINLFPIPMLDGGHLLFYLIEAIKGEALAEKYQEYSLKVGMVFILGLAGIVTANDIIGLFS